METLNPDMPSMKSEFLTGVTAVWLEVEKHILCTQITMLLHMY